MEREQLNRPLETVKATMKLTLSGALICAVGWSMLVLDETGRVAESEADIVTNVPKRAIVGENFTEVMASSGLTPKPYEFNGNNVFFAVGYTDDSPMELLDQYQQNFVDAGVNMRKYMKVPESRYKYSLNDYKEGKVTAVDDYEREYNAVLVNGGVVPVAVTEQQVTMGGLVVKGSNQGRTNEVFPEWELGGGIDLGNMMEGFRFIEAKKVREDGQTRVTSVWADDDFDFDKMNNPNQKGVRSVVKAPACVGCELGSQMKSLALGENYSISNMFTSRNIGDTRAFYVAAMKNRGWKRSDASAAVSYARRELGVLPDVDLLNFTRAGAESTIMIYKDMNEAQTRVSIVESF